MSRVIYIYTFFFFFFFFFVFFCFLFFVLFSKVFVKFVLFSSVKGPTLQGKGKISKGDVMPFREDCFPKRSGAQDSKHEVTCTTKVVSLIQNGAKSIEGMEAPK